jgi:molybdopterin-guanine dinucleotide biosynthesis protein A
MSRQRRPKTAGRGVLTAPRLHVTGRRGENTAPHHNTIEICILAGGLSTRMGRDKARLRIGNRTMLRRVRATAEATRFPVRVVRRDVVMRCGPLGGILTALKTSRAGAVLFLACDMPLVSEGLLHRLMKRSRAGTRATFAVQSQRAGFPLIIPVVQMPLVEQQIARNDFSIQQLAAALKAGGLRIRSRSRELFNVNTPEDVPIAQQLLRRCSAIKSRRGRVVS